MAIVLPGNLPLCTHRYLLAVSYLGSQYQGSQRQASRDEVGSQNTIQEALEWSLESFLPKRRCKVTSSSRTDKGVHALGNCWTLPLMDFEMPTEYILRSMNRNLSNHNHDIKVNDVMLVKADFHPQNLATGREYIYRLAVFDDAKYGHLNNRHNPTNILHLLPITELNRALPITSFNFDKAMEVINMFNGEHDFASFARKDETNGKPHKTVRDMSISITRSQIYPNNREIPYPYSLYEFHFKSRAFLYNQIRRMMGALLCYASYGRIDLKRIRFMLENANTKNWSSKLIIAEPWGLFLSRITYNRSAFEGAYRSMMDKTEVPIDEFNLPVTVGISDDIPESESGEEAETEKVST